MKKYVTLSNGVKLLSTFLCLSVLLSLAACGQSSNTQGTESTQTAISAQDTEAETVSNPDAEEDIASVSTEETVDPKTDEDISTSGSHILIAYFSRADENYNVGVIEKGNTEILAEMIAEETGGDLFKIERVTPYPADYDECTDEAMDEQRANARPELTATVENWEDYDVIYLGTPVWWGDMPMPVYTFLESYDFTGKTVYPFVTHEGSGLAGIPDKIAAALPGAAVQDGLAIRGTTAQNSREDAKTAITDWLGL